MIKGYCRTNLDDAKRHEWPTEFVAIPSIGDRVEAINREGHLMMTCSCLKVVGITHKMIKDPNYNKENDWGECKLIPVIEVELNKEN